jgi:hypothetical protein
MTVLDLDWELLNHLGDPDSFYQLQAEVSDELIVDPLAQRVFNWQVKHAREHNCPATASVLQDEFETLEVKPPETAVGDLIDRIKNRYVWNQGRKKIENMAATAQADPSSVGKEMIDAGRELTRLTTRRGEVYGQGDYERAVREYDKKAIKGSGPSLGFIELDDHFYGQNGITFLAAAPKTYKSWMTINALVSNINYGGFPYLYSLELPAIDTYWRLVCMRANLPYWKYLRSQLTGEEKEAIRQEIKALDDAGNYMIEKPRQGERSAAQLVEKAINVGASCVFIDQLQYVEAKQGVSLGALNQTGYYFEVCDDLRNYSDEIPIFVVHQFNRSVMNATEMPAFQQLKGSSAIEEVSTLVLGLYTNKDMRSSNLVEIGTMLSRNYPHANWELGVELSQGCKFIMNGAIDENQEG